MKGACLVRDIPNEARIYFLQDETNRYAQQTHKGETAFAAPLRQPAQPHSLSREVKITSFRRKQKMRLRTFDDGGTTRVQARATDIKDQRPQVSPRTTVVYHNFAKSGWRHTKL